MLRGNGSLLIGIIVLQAAFGGFSAQVIAFVHPTIIGEMRSTKSVIVANLPVVDEHRVSRPNGADIGGGESFWDGGGEWEFSGGEHREQASDVRLHATFWPIDDDRIHFHDIRNDIRKSHIICGRLSVIFSHESDFGFSGNAEVFNVAGNNPNVSTQLLFLLVLHGHKLILTRLDLLSAIASLDGASYHESESEKDVDRDAKSESDLETKVLLIVDGVLLSIFVVLFSKGFKRLIYGRYFLGGAAMMLLGWLSAATAVGLTILWFLGHSIWPFAENAAVSSFSGASAPCYGVSEDVGVVPVIIAELELRDIEVRVLLADPMEGADDAALDERPEAFNRIGWERR